MAIKTIRTVTPFSNASHPALGGLNQVEYTDGTFAKVYDETFFQQSNRFLKYIESGKDRSGVPHLLVGECIDTEDCYYTLN